MTRPPTPAEMTMDQILRTRNSSYLPEHDVVFNLCDRGVLSLYLHDVDISTDAAGLEDWTRAPKGSGITDSNSSDAHLTTKLTGAYWLEKEGHTMPTTVAQTRTGIPSYRFTAECFETSTTSHRADVACCCPDHTTIVEAGYTPPTRLLRAFGYRYYDDLSVATEDEVGGAVRVTDTVCESFCVAPYRFDGIEHRPIFEFRPVDLPTPDCGTIGAEASRIIED